MRSANATSVLCSPPITLVHLSSQVYRYVFKGIDHGEILRNPESAEYVKRLIINITK